MEVMESTRSESPAENPLAGGGPEIAGPAPRHRTVGVTVGEGQGAVTVGGGAPIVVQSMTNTDTADIDATVAQVAQLARLDVVCIANVEWCGATSQPLADGWPRHAGERVEHVRN